MTVQLLTIFKLCLLAFLYLFFLRVLRAVWVELKEPKPTPAAAPATTLVAAGKRRAPKAAKKAGASPSLRVIEPPEQRGRTFELVDELTMGRAPGCHIQLDDRFVSQLHARIFLRDGQVFVEDLGSTNGTLLNGNKVTAPAVVAAGGHVKVGNFVLELQ